MKVPEGPFSEFTLVSSALNGWKYDVMKFDSRKHVDITSWAQPLKLNRKELKRVAPVDSTTADRYIGATPMKGLDGKEVVRADGSQVMLDKEGRVIPAEGYVPPPKTGQGRKRIQKKTRQVYIIPDEQRQLKKDERYPWILEDASKKEVWVGRMDDAERSDTQAFFMPAMNNSFKFVPSHRWYKFQKRPNYYVPTLEEAEDIVSQATIYHDQLKKKICRWLSSKRTRTRMHGYCGTEKDKHRLQQRPRYSKLSPKDVSCLQDLALWYIAQVVRAWLSVPTAVGSSSLWINPVVVIYSVMTIPAKEALDVGSSEKKELMETLMNKCISQNIPMMKKTIRRKKTTRVKRLKYGIPATDQLLADFSPRNG